jgi:hypothetical protein
VRSSRPAEQSFQNGQPKSPSRSPSASAMACSGGIALPAARAASRDAQKTHLEGRRAQDEDGQQGDGASGELAAQERNRRSQAVCPETRMSPHPWIDPTNVPVPPDHERLPRRIVRGLMDLTGRQPGPLSSAKRSWSMRRSSSRFWKSRGAGQASRAHRSATAASGRPPSPASRSSDSAPSATARSSWSMVRSPSEDSRSIQGRKG